jgi:hypothetical protein
LRVRALGLGLWGSGVNDNEKVFEKEYEEVALHPQPATRWTTDLSSKVNLPRKQLTSRIF